MKTPIYLDYMATTPVDIRVVEKMLESMGISGNFGNSSSTAHMFGRNASHAIEQARQEVAALCNAQANEIIWTSGATEANNLALKGAALFYQRKGRHIISTSIEHKSVLDTLSYLETQGFEITYLKPDTQGFIAPAQIKDAIRSDTLLVSIQHANNEIGVIQDIQSIGAITRAQGVILHVDAAQSAGKIPIDLTHSEVDLMSFSAHKVYGPKGIGALYVRRKPRVRLQPLLHGGGHEGGLRAGTLPTHQIVGMGEAFRIARQEMSSENTKIYALREQLWSGIATLSDVYLNGDWDNRLPGNLNVSFNFVEGESLLLSLCDLAVATGSACNSATIEPSYVLRAIGRSNELAHSSIRFSLGRFTTQNEISYAVAHICHAVNRLRSISPLIG